MYVCTYLCVCVCVCVCTSRYIMYLGPLRRPVCPGCMYACTYVCVWVYVCVYVHRYIMDIGPLRRPVCQGRGVRGPVRAGEAGRGGTAGGGGGFPAQGGGEGAQASGQPRAHARGDRGAVCAFGRCDDSGFCDWRRVHGGGGGRRRGAGHRARGDVILIDR